MTRQIEIYLVCDWEGCDERSPEGGSEVVERTIGLDNRKPKSFNLCKEHNEEFEEILMPLLQRGVAVESRPAKSARTSSVAATAASTTATSSAAATSTDERTPAGTKKIRCLEDGCSKLAGGAIGLAQHVIRAHGYESLSAYKENHGLT